MKEKKYSVIWMDDKCNDISSKYIRKEAKRNDIKLVGFENAVDGLAALRKNQEDYDAILLDGLFYATKEQTGDNIDEGALDTVLNQLSSIEKKLTPFILSGKTSFTAEKNSVLKFKSYIKRVYDKSERGDRDQLWIDIKEEADKLEETQLKHKYADIFELCDEKYLGESNKTRFFTFLKHLEDDNTLENTEALFNPIRKTIESIFLKLNSVSIIPNEVYETSINGCGRFLSSRDYKYTFSEYFIPPLISELIDRLLKIVQDASHDERESLKLNVDKHIQTYKSNFLYKSAVYQLLEILIWLKIFIDKNPNPEENEKLWNIKISSKEETNNIITPFEGIIGQDKNGNYYCNEAIFAYTHINNIHEVGKKIRVIEIIANDKPTKIYYPSFITKFEIK